MLLKSHRLRPAAPEEGDFCVWELIWNGALDLFATKTALKQPSVLVSLSLHSEPQTNHSITLLEGIVVTTTAQCLTSNVNLKGFFFLFFFANSGPFLPNKPNYYCSDGFHLRSWSKAILNKTIRAFSLPHNSVQNSDILRFLLLRFLTFPLIFPLFLHGMDGETCRRAAEEAGEGKWRGWMCCWVLLNVLTCMKGEGFILGPLRGCPQIWTHTHTQKGSEARKPGDGPDLPLYQSCFESCWCYAFLSLQHNTIFLEMDHKRTQGKQ